MHERTNAAYIWQSAVFSILRHLRYRIIKKKDNSHFVYMRYWHLLSVLSGGILRIKNKKNNHRIHASIDKAQLTIHLISFSDEPETKIIDVLIFTRFFL